MPARQPSARAGGARPEALFKPPPERQPLAARMRPRTLEEFVGQEQLVREQGPLRRSVAPGRCTRGRCPDPTVSMSTRVRVG